MKGSVRVPGVRAKDSCGVSRVYKETPMGAPYADKAHKVWCKRFRVWVEIFDASMIREGCWGL